MVADIDMFTVEVKKRFQDPVNAGELEEFNAHGFASGEDCSDIISIKLDIRNNIIEQAKFQVKGCPGAICTSDVFIDLIKGLKIDEAKEIGESRIAEKLGKFPKEYLHCARLPIMAFRRAIKQFRPKIIGITGGKGGTGKSTLAASFANELSKEHKVLLVDADVDCPNDHLLLGIERKYFKEVEQRLPVWDLQKCLKCGKCGQVCKTKAIVSLKEKYPIFLASQCNGCGACLIACPENAIGWGRKSVGRLHKGSKGLIDLLSGELKANEPISEFVVNALGETIRQIEEDYEYIIIDTAAGTHCPVIAALRMCDVSFAVTEPTPLGAHDLDLILALSAKLHLKTDIILNRADIGDSFLIEEVADRHRSSIVSRIPYSKEILSKYSKGELIEISQIKKAVESIKK